MHYWFGFSTSCPDLRHISSGRGYSLLRHLLKRIVTRTFAPTPDTSVLPETDIYRTVAVRLVIKGAKPPELDATALSSAVG